VISSTSHADQPLDARPLQIISPVSLLSATSNLFIQDIQVAMDLDQQEIPLPLLPSSTKPQLPS